MESDILADSILSLFEKLRWLPVEAALFDKVKNNVIGFNWAQVGDDAHIRRSGTIYSCNCAKNLKE